MMKGAGLTLGPFSSFGTPQIGGRAFDHAGKTVSAPRTRC
jgi:hypothetical protein